MPNPIPFRWNIQKREQLGGLLRYAHEPVSISQDFLDDLRDVAARILAFANGADLAFIGRSPENLFDYLSGLFLGIRGAPRLHLVQFSMRYSGDGVDKLPRQALEGLAAYFKAESIDPETISTAPAPLALIDFVASGGTMQSLISILKWQSQQSGVDWNAVQRRLKIIGLTTRTKNSPNTWRWQQNQDWLDIAPDLEVLNVSAEGRFTYGIANSDVKVTKPHHNGRWAEAFQQQYTPSPEQLKALDLATRLYDLGQQKAERLEIAKRIAATDRMTHRATRQLVLNLKH